MPSLAIHDATGSTPGLYSGDLLQLPGLFGFHRNGCSASAEISVRLRPKSVYDLGRNRCSAPSEMAVRFRPSYTVSSSTPNSRAICKLFNPSPAASTIRARKASCWPVVNARTNRSNSTRSRSLSTTFGGLGVAIIHSGQIRMNPLTRPSHQSRLPSADQTASSRLVGTCVTTAANWLPVGVGSSTDWRATNRARSIQPAADRATSMKLTPKNSTTKVITYRSTLLCEVTLPTALRKNKPAKTQVPARSRSVLVRVRQRQRELAQPRLPTRAHPQQPDWPSAGQTEEPCTCLAKQLARAANRRPGATGNHEQTQDDRSGDGKPLMNQHILSCKCFTNCTQAHADQACSRLLEARVGSRRRESLVHISSAVRDVTYAPAWIGRRSDRVSAAEEGGGRPMWRLPPAERRCKTAPTSTFRARRAGRSSLRATSSPDHGPNQVVSASRNPASVPSPTQATCPSGLTSTADGAVTSPTTGSSQMPA